MYYLLKTEHKCHVTFILHRFGTRNIMQFYGVLLANFEHNTTHLNLCIFTMMHHIAGDCEKMDVLLQLPIIQALMEVDGSKNHVTKVIIV